MVFLYSLKKRIGTGVYESCKHQNSQTEIFFSICFQTKKFVSSNKIFYVNYSAAIKLCPQEILLKILFFFDIHAKILDEILFVIAAAIPY